MLNPLIAGPQSDDWLGYADIYADQGGWLADQKRDPAFTWLIRQAYSLLGPLGYEKFRSLIFLVFAFFAGWLSMSVPRQERLRAAGVVLASVAVVSTFLLKAFVQIREGIAFLFIAYAMVRIYASARPGIYNLGICILVAILFHYGMIVFAISWCVTALCALQSDRALTSKTFEGALLSLGLIIGAAVGWAVSVNANDVRYILYDAGVNETAHVSGYLWKYIYWISYGVILIALRHQVVEASTGATRVGRSFAVVIANFLFGFLYSVCAILVFSNFGTPALTAMFIRLLYTAMEIGVLVVILRGRGSILTLGVVIFMTIDRLRLITDIGNPIGI